MFRTAVAALGLALGCSSGDGGVRTVYVVEDRGDAREAADAGSGGSPVQPAEDSAAHSSGGDPVHSPEAGSGGAGGTVAAEDAGGPDAADSQPHSQAEASAGSGGSTGSGGSGGSVCDSRFRLCDGLCVLLTDPNVCGGAGGSTGSGGAQGAGGALPGSGEVDGMKEYLGCEGPGIAHMGPWTMYVVMPGECLRGGVSSGFDDEAVVVDISPDNGVCDGRVGGYVRVRGNDLTGVPIRLAVAITDGRNMYYSSPGLGCQGMAPGSISSSVSGAGVPLRQ